METIVLLTNGIPHLSFNLHGCAVIGRSFDCEIQFIDPRVSRRHARLFRDGEGWRLEDLGSCNGTFHCGRRLDGSVRLKPGDEFQVGDQVMVFDPPIQLLHARVGDKSLYLVDEREEPEGVTLEAMEYEDPSLLDFEGLVQLHDLTCEVMAELDIALFSDHLLDRLTRFFHADRGYVLLRDGTTSSFRPLAVKTDGEGIAVSKTLLDRLVEYGKPMLFDAATEIPLFGGAESLIRHELRSAMLVPLLKEGRVVGVVQLDSGRAGAFSRVELSKLAFLSRVITLALENAWRYEKERRKAQLASHPESVKGGFLGEDPKVLELMATVERAAVAGARVVLTGETGTGKELLARMVHERSRRSEGPWVVVNCAAIPSELLESELFGHERGAFTGAIRRKKGCFELADGGTLFLDEIADLAPSMQVKLLRAIQEGSFQRLGAEKPIQVDVRIVSATSQDLEARVREGRFREDLYYRLNVVRVHVPPLRERSGDIRLLFEHFLGNYARRAGRQPPSVSGSALAALLRYSWPGNVRELKNVAERLMVLTDAREIALMDLPADIREPAASGPEVAAELDLHGAVAVVERRLITQALRRARGSKTAACKLLGISRPTLNKKIAALAIEMNEMRS